jgi:hypothetical protein
MIERAGGKIMFVCDRCGEELMTDTKDFKESLGELKEAGWKNVKVKDEWTNLCEECGEKNDKEKEGPKESAKKEKHDGEQEARMRAKITKDGALMLERKGAWRNTACPYTMPIPVPAQKSGVMMPGNGMNLVRMSCGDQCPLFGEPTRYHTNDGQERYTLKLCTTALVGLELTDEREVRT